eukprot:s3396_g4.t2
MGAQCARGCRCDCERQCTRFISFVFGTAFLAAGAWLTFPFMWSNPYVADRQLTCSEVSWASSFPAITASLSLCWCLVFYGASESPVPTAIAGSCLAVTSLFFGAIALLILNGNCEGEDQEYVVSIALMVVVPLALPFCCGCCSILNSCLDSCARADRADRADRGAGAETAPQRPSRRRVPRVRRAQRMLREALILGDSNVADLLLDFKERRCHLLWRMYRCVFMTFMHCQLRCSCCAGVPEDDVPKSPASPASGGHATPTSRASVSRASLFFSYDDEDAGEMAIHYLCRGERFTSEGGSTGPSAAAQRCLNWGGQKRTLPELTDERRARLLRELVNSGRLPLGQLYAVNAFAQTPLHCAASSGSSAVVQDLLNFLEPTAPVGAPDLEDHARGEMLMAEDVNGDSPCEAALRNGQVTSASILAGEYGHWQGLLKLPQQRQALRECLTGALGQMSPEPPQAGQQQKAKLLIHEDANQLLSHLDQQIRQLQTLCGLVLAGGSAQLVPRNAAEALLRSHEFDVQAAAAAFRKSPREALDAAGLKGLDLRLASDGSSPSSIRLDETLQDGGASSLCIICFDEVDLAQSACKLFLCKHVVCDNCMSMHIKVRLDEGDVAGIACPEPNCRLPISEDMLKRIFGAESAEQAKYEQLKTLKFVDMSKNMAWCPSPGCGRVVSYPNQERSEKSSMATTVVCTCGCTFCFACKHLNGHEPVPCQAFADFLKDLAVVRRQMQDETNKWLAKNSKTCTCGAIIQRSGGCNHMICSVCGRHFCYMCGQDWAPHRGQPGGFDYYQCRLPTSEGNTTEGSPKAPQGSRDGKLWKLQREAMPGWTASERQPERLKLLFRALLCLAEEFNLGISIEEPRGDGDSSFLSAISRESRGGRQSAWEALLACIKARRCLQNCYVLKYHWAPEQWRRSRLRNWVPELEGIVGALESAIGVSLLETQAVRAGFPTSAEVAATGTTPKQLPKNPRDVLRLFDLRQLLPQVIAISETLSTLRQLSRAVSLQTERILDAGKSGFPEVGVVEEIWNKTLGDLPRRARSERCAVM